MLNSINLRDFLELNQTRKDYVGKFLGIRFHVRIIWIIHANQAIQRRKKMFLVCSTNPVLGLGGYKHLGLTAKYRANLKQLLKNRWILSHSVSAYPIHISSSFKDTASKWRGILLLLQHLSWLASHRAVCSSLVFFSSRLSGRFIKTAGSAPPDPDFRQTPWNSFVAP